MSDRFSDENFIEAARVYQNIKAPSDLREKVLMGKGAPAQVQKTKHTSGKIYRLASLAACIAIMAAALPAWMTPDADGGAVTMVPEVPDTAQMIRMVPEPDSADPAGEPVMASEPTVPDEPDTPAASPEPVQAAAGAETIEPEKKPAAEEKPAAGEKESEPEDFAEPERETESQTEEEPPVISIGKLLPVMLAADTSLDEMEVRILSTEDGSCRVEVTTADHKTAEVTMSRNEEDGHWEFQSSDETV